jgi:hypothetical protein
MRVFIAVCLFSISPLAYSQPSSTGSATASGACAIAHSGNRDTFVINCGISEEQGKKMIAMLNKILANQIDPALVMNKLDEILAQRQPTQVVNAPNGIGAIGSTLVNPTVNNFAPPSRTLTADQKSRLAAAAEEIPKSIMVVIGSADDGESQSYAEEIRQVFLQHGTTRARGTLFGWHPTGVFIQVHSADDAVMLVAQKLGSEMNQMGFSIEHVEIAPDYVHQGEIHVLVGDQ